MLEHSDVTGKSWQSEEAVYFRNPAQSGFYIGNGATILDVFADSENKMVVVFPREDHNVLWKKWMDNKKECFREQRDLAGE